VTETTPSRRRLAPDDRRSELLALGAEVFGSRPYDEVRIDEIAERAGVSRALMYHYFPDKRAFFAAVIRDEADRLFEATSTPQTPDQTLFDRLRAGVLAYVEYHERHPQGAWAAHVGLGRTDPALFGLDDEDNDRQVMRIMSGITDMIPVDLGELDPKLDREIRSRVLGWLAFTFEMCKQRILDPTLDAGHIADACAHMLLDTIARVPGIPLELADAVSVDLR
jgi:AcrR family transcriptional regulator